MPRRLIGVIGDGTLDEQDPRYALARALGTRLVDADFAILCGGRGGVMEAVARGAHDSEAHTGASVFGLLPGPDSADANPWVDLALGTGLADARNALCARADAVIAIGGGAGTLSEIALAWVFCRTLIAFRCEGWSGRLADTALDDRRPGVTIRGVDTPAEAIQLLLDQGQ